MLQSEGWRVHVDYSDNMHVSLTKEFLEENNVRFLIQVEEEMILFTDRFGYLQANEVQTKYADLKSLFSDLRKKKGEKTNESGSKI